MDLIVYSRCHGDAKIFLLHIPSAAFTGTEQRCVFAATTQRELCDGCMAESNVNFLYLIMSIHVCACNIFELPIKQQILSIRFREPIQRFLSRRMHSDVGDACVL